MPIVTKSQPQEGQGPNKSARYYGTQKKECNQFCPLTSSQSEGHNDSESRHSSPVEEGGSHSGSSKESGSAFDAGLGSQSDNLGANAESESGSQEDANTSPPAITDDDTMVMIVNIHEPDPTVRPQLIACYRSMWIVNMFEEFFNKGIVTKNGIFKKCAIMPETRVVVVISRHSPILTTRGYHLDVTRHTRPQRDLIQVS
uniref:Uncharacterized protein n=1 Tax=Solanum tuberosum TaxID=4113 RepID=M1DH52_SOLTU